MRECICLSALRGAPATCRHCARLWELNVEGDKVLTLMELTFQPVKTGKNSRISDQGQYQRKYGEGRGDKACWGVWVRESALRRWQVRLDLPEGAGQAVETSVAEGRVPVAQNAWGVSR